MASEEALRALSERAAKVRATLDDIKKSFTLENEDYSAGVTEDVSSSKEDETQSEMRQKLRANTDQIHELMSLAEQFGKRQEKCEEKETLEMGDVDSLRTITDVSELSFVPNQLKILEKKVAFKDETLQMLMNENKVLIGRLQLAERLHEATKKELEIAKRKTKEINSKLLNTEQNVRSFQETENEAIGKIQLLEKEREKTFRVCDKLQEKCISLEDRLVKKSEEYDNLKQILHKQEEDNEGQKMHIANFENEMDEVNEIIAQHKVQYGKQKRGLQEKAREAQELSENLAAHMKAIEVLKMQLRSEKRFRSEAEFLQKQLENRDVVCAQLVDDLKSNEDDVSKLQKRLEFTLRKGKTGMKKKKKLGKRPTKKVKRKKSAIYI